MIPRRRRRQILNEAVLLVLPSILAQWLPDGCLVGNEYIARNPTRDDRQPGSFKINVRTGLWSDFATDDSGRGAISLATALGISVRTLDRWHRMRKGPPRIAIGRKRMYRAETVRRWLEENETSLARPNMQGRGHA